MGGQCRGAVYTSPQNATGHGSLGLEGSTSCDQLSEWRILDLAHASHSSNFKVAPFSTKTKPAQNASV